MKRLALLLFSFGLVSLMSCGGNMKSPPVVVSPFISLNGNFSFTGTSQAFSPNMIFIGGPMQTDSNGHISGMLGVSNSVSNCITTGTTAAFTGNIDGMNVVSLTSAPINGQVVSFSTTARPNGTFAAGTYSVAGGCLAGDHGSLQAQHLLTGTYTGSVLINGSPINVALNFAPPGPPDATGAYSIQASGTFTNTAACGGFASLSTEGGSQDGLMVSFKMAAGASPVLSFSGTTIDGTANMLSGTLGITGGPCDQLKGTLNLSK
jgi:hypothetical protein